jgi:DNA-binding transcriptional regulator YiaG
MDVNDAIRVRDYSTNSFVWSRRSSTSIDTGNKMILFNASKSTGQIGIVVLADNGDATAGSTAISKDALTLLDNYKSISKLERSWANWAERTKLLLQKFDPISKRELNEAAQLRVERLTRIQAAFGLSTLELARTLRITRQGLYKWLDATKQITLQATSRQRLAIVEQLAKLWCERTKSTLGSVAQEPLTGGRTVMQLLADDGLDEKKIVSAFDELFEKLHGKPPTLSQRMAEAGLKRRPSARSLPADEK